VLRRDLQSAEQVLNAPVDLAEVHVAEAQVVEEVWVVGVLAEELLQVDTSLVELAGGEELEGAGEVVAAPNSFTPALSSCVQ
jgi:hypothetical protein